MCGGDGIAEGDCDCQGNQLDVCGVCGGNGYFGCTNPEACNYDAGACGDNGSCDVPFLGCQECVDGVSTPIDSNGDGINDCDEVPGCTDPIACNYDEAANTSDGSCEYADDFYECDGETCINDTDGDGVCDELEIAGCQDEVACNYAADATDDDGSCSVPDLDCQECVDGTATDIDTDGDGVRDCEEVAGCQDETACNYNELATDAAVSGLNISLTAGSYASEISWTLNGEEYDAPFEGFIALDEGSYTIAGFDSYGDGWNGAEMTLSLIHI